MHVEVFTVEMLPEVLFKVLGGRAECRGLWKVPEVWYTILSAFVTVWNFMLVRNGSL